MKQISDIRHIAKKESEVEEKLDSLIALLNANDFDSETVKQFQQRFNDAIAQKEFGPQQINAFKAIGQNEDASREELLDEFSVLFESNKLDSNVTRQYIRGERMAKSILILVGIVMITLGFAMIIMPAPPYFEMFTIFYFTRDDGVTLMDLISLIIILFGIYILMRSIYKKNVTSK